LAASYRGAFTPVGAASRAAARKRGHYRDALVHQLPQVVFHPFAFDVVDGLHSDAEKLVKRLQGLASQVELAHDNLVWFLVHRRSVILSRGQQVDN
jgi:hypothetical protein